MMKKRGQVTLFVIIGILILLTLSLGYYALTVRDTQVVAESQKIPPTQTTLPVKYLVDKCLSMISTQAVTLLGKRGGYIERRPPELTPDMIRLTEREELSYFYIRHSRNLLPKKGIPSIKYMEQEIENYVKHELRYCLDDFEFFATKGITVKMQDIAVNTTISDKAVAVALHFPVTIQTLDKVTTLEDYLVTLPVRLGEIHQLATKIVEETGSYEQRLRDEITQKINACDQNPTLGTKPTFQQLAAQYPRLKLITHESDCKQEVGFCGVWTVKVTVYYKVLLDCNSETKEVQQLAPLITVYGIVDDDAPQHPFTFLFLTKINLDAEGTCHYGC